MKPWVELYRAHRDMRRGAGKDASADIRKCLKKLVELGHCDGSLLHRFTYDKNSPAGLRTFRINRHEEGGEPLRDLPYLKDARLTVLLLIGMKTEDLHELTIMVEGRTHLEAQWCVAVHLPDNRNDDRQGSGACGHAALHCHVGPTLDDEPKVRVPLPALRPAEALDWILSQVIPDYEPAPWAEVGVILTASRS